MIIPYKVDVLQSKRPYANYLIIALTIFVFSLIRIFPVSRFKPFVLDGEWSVVALLGHMWLHVTYSHIIMNLVFLWVFGNAVCAKLGDVLYLVIYVSTGVLAGVVHIIVDGRTSGGASSAIFGIIGTYFVLYPFHSISCLFVAVPFSVAGLWVILGWFILNIFGTLFFLFGAEVKTNYLGHIAGFIVGLMWGIVIIKLKFVVRDSIDDAIIRQLKI